ncbi:peptidyl-tRNA hydrolase domain protein [Tirmania nivea]|nr:peptidyl-tRNA hydrolase domain protein [Tirmania nivea]
MEIMSARGILYGGLVRYIPLRVNAISGTLGAKRHFASSTPDQDFDEEGLKEARKWLSSFTPDSIPREYYDVSFSRSSGPGGQNVNKLNTKATLRLDLLKACNYIPSLVMARIRTDPNIGRYLTKHDELLIQSDTYRKQHDNVLECFRKLYQSIVEAAALPGETSAEQRDYVSKLKLDETERRMKMKKQHSNKKSSRKSKGDY